MYDYIYNAFFYEVGALLSGPASEQMIREIDGWDVSGLSLTVSNGVRALYSYNFNTDYTNTNTYHFMPLQAGETMPARLISQLSGIGFVDTWYYDNTYGPTFAYIEALWLDIKVGLVRDILEQWCNATTEEPVISDVYHAATGVYVTSVMLMAKTPTDCIPIVMSLYGSRADFFPVNNDGGTQFYMGSPEATLGKIAPAPTGSSADLARVANAVEELSMSRIEVSANNGDSMFNIVGGTRASSED